VVYEARELALERTQAEAAHVRPSGIAAWVPGEHGPGLFHESEMAPGALKPDAAPFPVFSSWARNW